MPEFVLKDIGVAGVTIWLPLAQARQSFSCMDTPVPILFGKVATLQNGRAAGGVADTLAIRSKEPEAFCDDALGMFHTAFARALWRGRLRRLHAAGRLALDQDWAAELGLSACDVNDVIKESPFGAAWNMIEDRSSPFAGHLPRPAELPRQIAIARRSLSLLREGGSGARQDVQTKFSISVRPPDDAARSHLFDEESNGLVAT
jgi:hypothetical protein